MTRSRALVSVIALLLAGVVIGALGMRLVDAHRFHGRPSGPPDPESFVHELEARLALTADQREKVRELLEETHRKGDAIRQALKPQLDRQIEETQQPGLGSIRSQSRDAQEGLLFRSKWPRPVQPLRRVGCRARR